MATVTQGPLGGHRRLGAGAAWLAAALALAFPDVLFLGRSLSTGQASGLPGTMPDGPWGFDGHRPGRLHVSDGGCSAWYHEPIYEKVRREYRRGRLPLWNRHAGVGAPLAADPQSGAFDLLRIPLVVSGGPLARDLQLLVRLLVSGLGCFLLFRTLRLPTLGSTVGAALFMLNGHFVLNINWGNLGPVLLLPWVVLAMVHGGATGRPLAAVVAVAATWSAGMPPSALIVVMAALAVGIAAGWSRGWRRVAGLLGMAAAGTGLAAPALIPAAEYLVNAHTYHSVGDGLRSVPLSYLPTSVFPLSARGWELGSPLGEATYMGTGAWTAFALFLVLLAMRSLGRLPGRRVLAALGLVGVVVLLKSYGAPAINELGRLPGLDRTLFYKHAAPLLWLAVAAGGGTIVATAGSARHRPLALALAGVVLLSAAGVAWARGGGAGLAMSFGFGVLVLLGAGVPLRPRVARGILACVILAEAILLVPKDHPSRHDTLAAPPYASMLGEGRSCGTDMTLYPNLASAVGVDDIRLLGPVLPRRYVRLLEEALGRHLVDRFEGSERRLFHDRRWVLDFLGVRRIVSAGALATSLEPEDMVADGACPSPPKSTVVRMDTEYVRAIYHHPAGTGEIPCRYLISLERPGEFLFRVGLHPGVWKRGMGDGVHFRITDGMEELFSRWVDPKNRAEDRQWFAGVVAADSILELWTLPGETPLYDWALWGDPRTDGREYPLIRRADVAVYENPRTMPFVSLTDRVTWVDDPAVALRHVVEGEGAAPHVAEHPPPAWWAAGALGGRAELVRRTDTTMEVRVWGGGLLLVRELCYPGWEARVDGAAVPVVPTDYLFQGVPVPPGNRTVILRFRPVSLRLGLAVSSASFVVLLLWSRSGRILRRTKRRNGVVQPPP